MYFVNDNFVDFKRSGIKEGGVVRNSAWIHFLQQNRANVRFIDFKITHRIFRYLNYLIFLFKACFIRKSEVFFLYPKVGLPVLGTGFTGNLFRKMFLFSVKTLIRHKNTLIFDISDIKYEQAIDLEIEGLDLEKIRLFEEKLFTLKNTKYIFASFSMRDYAVKKHKIPVENTDVCINGGFLPEENASFPIQDYLCSEDINFVYAGTLNKGRMIEEMINSFPSDCQKRLILLGTSGEWIPEYLEKNSRNNVIYLGAFEEKIARSIVSHCDVGMIPYDDSRLYYNIAYPTKLSFYIAAGIPYFSTPVAEINLVQEKFDLGYAIPLSAWKDTILSLDEKTLKTKKDAVLKHRENFTWKTIFENNRFV